MAKMNKRIPVATVVKSNKNLTQDSFSNFFARLGIQANQIGSDARYSLGPFLSRDRTQLEAGYRDSWLIGAVVDAIAEDMTRDGISMSSDMQPDDIQKLHVQMSRLSIWRSLCSTIKWARLYGGAIAVLLIEGADYTTPLNIDAIGRNQFKGLAVLDRWMIQPTMGELITDMCSDIGMPKYYEAIPGVSTFPGLKIHYSRVLRFDGIELPYYQKLFENLWGLSVIERMYDRLLAFDSATQGSAQLLYRAYLRVIGIEGFREALANGGEDENSVIKQFMYIRAMQSNEGITCLDSKDTFNTHSYTFSGISDLLQQFGQQISGATNIPLVRLFGQSPAGLSSTGESDLRNYYDHIYKLQENQIRPHLDKLLKVMSMSVLEDSLPKDFEFNFIPLWQINDSEKSSITSQDVNSISIAFTSGLISKETALKELLQQSRVTGRFTNITNEEIADAKNEGGGDLPSPEELDQYLNSEKKEAPIEEEEKGDITHGIDPQEQQMKIHKHQDKVSFADVGSLIKNFLKQHFSKDEFKEEEHPRAKSGEHPGQFVKKGHEGSKQEKFESIKIENGNMVKSDGSNLPEHIASLKIPPAWKDIVYNPDPSSNLLVKGKDAKGRVQYIYSIHHQAKQAEAKFARIDELNKKFNYIKKQNDDNLKGDKRECATIMALIMQTGIRPGSDEETHSKVKAYGVTTLEGRHVTKEGDNVFLHFIGKKGVENKILVEDKELSDALLERTKKVGTEGRIFGVNSSKLLEYSKSFDGGGFKTKDFRTLLGTKIAFENVKSFPAPQNEKDYKKKVMLVAKKVAEKLGNTPTVALSAYISPVVFSEWRAQI